MDQQLVYVDADIDIDLADRNILLDKIDHICASIINDDKLIKHKTGVYFQTVPVDPRTGYCSVDYKNAQSKGYFKVDFLNVGLLSQIKSNDYIYDLINKEPDWNKLQDYNIVKNLFHVHNHFDVLQTMKPDSVEKLAAVLAIIRPAKRHLLGKNWNEVLDQVWLKPQSEEYFFKKSHAIGYALTIVMQLNL